MDRDTVLGRQSIQFLNQYGEDLLPILLSERLCVRNANPLLFVYSSSDHCGLCFERGPISDSVKPVTKERTLSERTGLAYQHENGGLKSIFGIVPVPEHAPAST